MVLFVMFNGILIMHLAIAFFIKIVSVALSAINNH